MRKRDTLETCLTAPFAPTWFTTVLFFLLFSGPPMFRLRDPNASLEGIIDPVIILQVSVWVIAGVWSLLAIRKCSQMNIGLNVNGPAKLGLLMCILLSLSIPISAAPSLSAFKVGQMSVCVTFTLVFVGLYGVTRVLRYIFIASSVLCAGIALSAFVTPELVFIKDERGIRLRGDLIADTGVVSAYAIMLLIVRGPKIRRAIFWPLLSCLLVLLSLSLTREAWIVVLAFIVLFVVKRIRGVVVRRIGYAVFAALPAFSLFYLLPALQSYRSTESIWTLSDRTGLWLYLAGITIARSPWIGLGYYSASRIFGPEYNPGLGTAHSMFLEVFAGGGALSIIPLVLLSIWLCYKALRLIVSGNSRVEFAYGTLLFATLAFAAMGADAGSGPVGITFWTLAAAIPILPKRLALARGSPAV